jgi:hypothetical protein
LRVIAYAQSQFRVLTAVLSSHSATGVAEPGTDLSEGRQRAQPRPKPVAEERTSPVRTKEWAIRVNRRRRTAQRRGTHRNQYAQIPQEITIE